MDGFTLSGFSAGNTFMCALDGDTLYQVDYMGGKKAIGKTLTAFEELSTTTGQYYDKLVELGVIVPQKAPEVMMAEMQGTMLEMSKIISGLSAELKELKENGLDRNPGGGGEDVPPSKPKRSSSKGPTGDDGDG